jgi:hypothetical protein
MLRSFCEACFTVHPSRDLLIHATISRTLKAQGANHDHRNPRASLQARIQKQLQATGSSSFEEVLLRLCSASNPSPR